MNNPYQAPTAAVADPVEPPVPRPPEATLAFRLLWLSFAVGLLTLLPGVRQGFWETEPVPAALTAGVVALFAGGFAFLLYKAARRRNWARWLVLGWLAYSWYETLADLDALNRYGLLPAAVDVVTPLMEIAAMGLLFFGPGGRWFRR